MIKPVKYILFATNLSENCKPAFDFAASLATRYQATIVLLHVIEKMPDYIEGRLKGLLGKEKWQQTIDDHAKDAREALIGKKSSNTLIRAALDQFCSEAGIDDDSCGYHAREIVVSSGEVVDDIISNAKQYECDIIIMGTKQTLISKKTAIGQTIKGVLRGSKIPVLVVPPDPR